MLQKLVAESEANSMVFIEEVMYFYLICCFMSVNKILSIQHDYIFFSFATSIIVFFSVTFCSKD